VGILIGLVSLWALLVTQPASAAASSTIPQSASVSTPSAAATFSTRSTSPQELVWLNARLALREGRTADVLKLWLIRNSLLDRGQAPLFDVDFRSLVWAALGESGLCPDGFIDDEDGAGLWPLAVHNWLIKNQRRSPQPSGNAFVAFGGGMQARPVSLFDVLDQDEFEAVRFSRQPCLVHRLLQPEVVRTGAAVQWVDMDDRISVGFALRDAIHIADETIDPSLVDGRAVLLTRLFDLNVALTRMLSTRARRETDVMQQVLRSAGVSPGGRLALGIARGRAFGVSDDATLWQMAMGWPASEWLALSEERRLSLFADADAGLVGIVSPQARDGLVLDVADRLLDQHDGAALTRWLGFVSPPMSPSTTPSTIPASDPGRVDARTHALRAALFLGERGERLLTLDESVGFRERSAVALHRGVHFLGVGDTIGALRSFAFAVNQATTSAESEKVHQLSRRWLAFVLSQYATTEEVIAVIERLVPTTDWGVVVESLAWRAAFHADTASFARVCEAAVRKKASAVRRSCAQLEPLVRSTPTAMWDAIVAEGDGLALRFGTRLVEELSTEPIDVRHNQQQTLQGLLAVCDDLSARGRASSTARIDGLRRRAQALLDGIAAFDESVRGRAERAAPDAEAYAGSVRLAPTDPLPWPFVRPSSTPPNPVRPVILRPVEDVLGGQRRFRFRITE
jgi:hypothetical protein